MRYTHCFWDLDGTITDSSPGITSSVRYALKRLNVDPLPAEKLLCFIGPPLLVGFSQFAGLNEEDSKKAVAYYRENYRAGAMLDCRIYDGIEELLARLQDAGIQNVLATCKPQIFAEAILKHFGLDSYFSLIAGAELDGSRDEKHQVIAYAAERLGLTDLSSCLMIGDRGSDVLGASHHGMDCAGVLWGFGSAEELSQAGAKIICENVAELSGHLLNA